MTIPAVNTADAGTEGMHKHVTTCICALLSFETVNASYQQLTNDVFLT